MPIRRPELSWEHLRNYTEKWQWIDSRTGVTVVGFNPPAGAAQRQQVPYYVRAVTADGTLLCGHCITLKLNRRRRQRMVKFLPSGECRWLRDYLIIEVDGVRFITH